MKITYRKIQASKDIKASYDVVLRDGEIYRVDDPDHDRYEIVEVHSKPYIKKANSIEEAEDMVRHYIEDYNLGGSEYTGGVVLENDKPVYYISYNGKATPFDEFIERWGTGIIHNSRVLKSLGITPEQYGYDPNVLHSSTDVEASKELPENQWTEEYDDEVGDYSWTYSNENGTAIIRPDGKDYKTPGDVGYDLLVKYAFNGDRPRMMREHYEGGGALESAMLSGEMRLFNFNPVESCDQVTASSDWVEGFTEGVGNYFDLTTEAGKASIYEMQADGDIGYGVLVSYKGKRKKDSGTFWGPDALADAKEYAEYCLKDEIESCSVVTAASSTWDRISGLEEQIAQLEASIEDAKAGGSDIEDLLPEYEELDRLKDELRFVWADDEAEYNYALQQQEFNPDGSLKSYGDGISFSTDVKASQIIPNGKIQKGLQWNQDWHRFEVQDVASDHKTCTVTEDWINEDTGAEEHREYTYYIVSDEKDPEQEYIYEDEYAEYAKPGSTNYSWWARKYASGADNYPWSWSDGENVVGEEPHDFDYMGYHVIYSPDQEVFRIESYLGSPEDIGFDFEDKESAMEWIDKQNSDDEYTPSATAGDYSPSNPWDAPGMSINDFI